VLKVVVMTMINKKQGKESVASSWKNRDWISSLSLFCILISMITLCLLGDIDARIKLIYIDFRQIMVLTLNSKVLYTLLSKFKRVKLQGCFILQDYHFIYQEVLIIEMHFLIQLLLLILMDMYRQHIINWGGPLLSKERSYVENLVQIIRNSWNWKCVTFVNDGWSDS